MLKVITFIIGLFSATALFWLGIGFEHRPAGWPNIPVNLGPFHWALHLPDSPFVKLARVETAERVALVQAQQIQAAQAQVSVAAGVTEAKAQVVIRTVHDTQIKEIPVYVTPQTDRSFPMPWGLVRVFNAGALGVEPAAISLPAGQSDDAASPVTASRLGAALTDNDTACHANSEQLDGLQAWVRAERAKSIIPAAKP